MIKKPAKKIATKAKPLVNGPVRPATLNKELEQIAKLWADGTLHGVIFAGVKKRKDGSPELHLVTVPGSLNRLEVMGLASELAVQINTQKI